MLRLSSILIGIILTACSSGKEENSVEENGNFDYEQFSDRFRKASVPYQLTDTGLLNNPDTAAIYTAAFAAFIPDSIRTRMFGKGARVRYIPLHRIEVPEAETYFVLKAQSGSKKAGLLVTFDAEKKYSASFPFLIPDADRTTSQVSSIDKSYSISRFTQRREEDNALSEGRDVYVFNKDVQQFTLIMTDVLDEDNLELINPIDTLKRTHKFAGDYVSGKRSLVSIRDGRNEGQLTVFVHMEKKEGACTGEIKGDLLITTTTSAIYRQGGDPCVMEFRFGSNSVTLRELEGCGARRGVDCVFDGTYSRKKEKRSTSGKSADKVRKS